MTSNPFIGRREAVGLGKEASVSPGTPVSADSRIPKKSGIIQPKYEVAEDSSGYGNIDQTFDTQAVKNSTDISLSGIVRDDFVGHLFMGALGTHTAVIMCTLGAPSGGTPARGDICNVGGTTWIGVIKKILTIGATTYYFVSTTSGTLVDAATMTNGTWSATVGGVTENTAVKGHFFERANTNTHPTYTIYGDDPVGAVYAPYSMVDKLSINGSIKNYMDFDVSYIGKKLVSTTAQSPAYTTANPFLAKNSSVKFADTESALNAAVAVCMQSFKLNINKNLTDVMCFGDTDISALYNQQFTLDGDLEALYDSTTLRDYIVNSTKEACRFQMINTEATAIVTGVYPSIYIDMAKLGFVNWKKSTDLNNIVKQTMGFKGQYDTATSMSIEILLLNKTSSAY